MNEVQAIIKGINTLFGITYRDGLYWTGLYYKGNTSQIGSKTWFGAVSDSIFR